MSPQHIGEVRAAFENAAVKIQLEIELTDLGEMRQGLRPSCGRGIGFWPFVWHGRVPGISQDSRQCNYKQVMNRLPSVKRDGVIEKRRLLVGRHSGIANQSRRLC